MTNEHLKSSSSISARAAEYGIKRSNNLLRADTVRKDVVEVAEHVVYDEKFDVQAAVDLAIKKDKKLFLKSSQHELFRSEEYQRLLRDYVAQDSPTDYKIIDKHGIFGWSIFAEEITKKTQKWLNPQNQSEPVA